MRNKLDKMSPRKVFDLGIKHGERKAYRQALYMFLKSWTHPFSEVNWRLWRRSLRDIACLRIKLQKLRDHALDGNEEGKALARDITNILNSKY